MKHLFPLFLLLLGIDQARNYQKPLIEQTQGRGGASYKVLLENRSGPDVRLTVGNQSRRTFDMAALSIPKTGWRSCTGNRLSSPWESQWTMVQEELRNQPVMPAKMNSKGQLIEPVAGLASTTVDFPRMIEGKEGTRYLTVTVPKAYYEQWTANCPSDSYRVDIQLRAGRNIIAETWWTYGGVTYHAIKRVSREGEEAMVPGAPNTRKKE